MICFHFTIFVVLETTNSRVHSYIYELWFAFILLSLSYWKQRRPADAPLSHGCDLLSFYYLCRTGNNVRCFSFAVRVVVICFHFTIFVVLETTHWDTPAMWYALWFAFILLSLSYWKQRWKGTQCLQLCCDLLSFYYLCRTGNNKQVVSSLVSWLWFAFILLSLSYWKQHKHANSCPTTVVICFHFTIFVVLETTEAAKAKQAEALWFAFILLSLSYWKQLNGKMYYQILVVICFHFTIFVVLETTGYNQLILPRTLWFAFILLSLSYWKQHLTSLLSPAPSCDLLSFYYLCRTGNNKGRTGRPVVGLWFAFILLSLSYWKQLLRRVRVGPVSCDLLSFYYLCRTGNNCVCELFLLHLVVICFHFTIFVVLETTESTLFVVFQYVIKIIGIQKMLFLIECNPADWWDYFFWLNLRIAPIAARECWRP